MRVIKFVLLLIVAAGLFVGNLFIGTVDIAASDVFGSLFNLEGPSDAARFIVIESRFPLACTAALAGMGLSVAGLLLQTAFRNPLAGPSILGISSGASLGVAVVVLLTGGSLSLGSIAVEGYVAVLSGAVVGSFAVMSVLFLLSNILHNDLMLLIAGVMIGYLVSSIITLLNFSATSEGVQSYVMWGMGNFNGVSLSRLPWFAGSVFLGLVVAFSIIKPLNIILLGDMYARNLGINLSVVRNLLLLSTGILTAAITACCGPVSFIGLAVPHLARLLFRTDDHRVLVPAAMLAGSVVALGCSLLCVVPERSVLPLNGVTPIVGVPVVLYIIMSRRK